MRLSALSPGQNNSLTPDVSTRRTSRGFETQAGDNRTGQSVTHGSGPSSSPTVSTSTNRITALGGSNYYYDSNGSLTQDDLFKYKYDAENRVVEIRNLSDTLLTSYAYDGHSMQVIKVASGTRTWFLYAGSKLVSEYYDAASNNYSSPTSPGSAPLDSVSTLLYQHADHLTTRVTTDNAGTLSNQQSHYPYGENWYATGTADPSVKRKFTSYRKETDSSLASGQINYAVARYHGSRIGRFHRPSRQNKRLPQNLNAYPTASSDPINRPNTDPPPPAEDPDVPLLPPVGPFMGWDSFWQWKWMAIAEMGWYPGGYMHDPNEWPPIVNDGGVPGYSPWMSLLDAFLGHFFPGLFTADNSNCALSYGSNNHRIDCSQAVVEGAARLTIQVGKRVSIDENITAQSSSNGLEFPSPHIICSWATGSTYECSIAYVIRPAQSAGYRDWLVHWDFRTRCTDDLDRSWQSRTITTTIRCDD